MAQLNWTYFSLTGRPYSIDMYHGEESGHLMLIINNAIIMIKFNQKKPEKYSFLIEHQMLELDISKNNNDYKYTVTPQPLNWDIEPEKTFDKHFWIPLSIIILLLSCGVVIFN
ncbi:MAG: hypothetical protein HKO89_03505 [Saprospiraceae bacterium]|nr:hypothetical protein [Bacteroidia bacterium]NNK89650.1 hypothetical protein [Saprospiraceae bacterium]